MGSTHRTNFHTTSFHALIDSRECGLAFTLYTPQDSVRSKVSHEAPPRLRVALLCSAGKDPGLELSAGQTQAGLRKGSEGRCHGSAALPSEPPHLSYRQKAQYGRTRMASASKMEYRA